MRVGGAARIDEDVIVRPFGLAFEDLAGSIAEHDAVAVALARLVGEKLAGIGDAAIVDHGVLHRDLDLLAATGHRALEERRQHANRGVQSVPVSPSVTPGLIGRAVVLARDRHRRRRPPGRSCRMPG